MAFNPEQHLISIRGKGGKPDYLETKWRIVWFRETHPEGAIVTEVLNFDPPLVKASVYNGAGQTLATGHAGVDADKAERAVWNGRSLEKAETAAIGRALANAGFGTQFVGQELDDGVADSPAQPATNGKAFDARQRLGNGGDRRAVKPEAHSNDGDLRDKATAEAFIAATRNAGLTDEIVLKALGVKKLSEWTEGRAKAGLVVRADTMERNWANIYEDCDVWFDEDTDAGRAAHCRNVYRQLVRAGQITEATSDDDAADLIIANRKAKQQTVAAG